ncbi:MAG: hypothetical protein QM676_06015 [Novosphingobium sp.]
MGKAIATALDFAAAERISVETMEISVAEVAATWGSAAGPGAGGVLTFGPEPD